MRAFATPSRQRSPSLSLSLSVRVRTAARYYLESRGSYDDRTFSSESRRPSPTDKQQRHSAASISCSACLDSRTQRQLCHCCVHWVKACSLSPPDLAGPAGLHVLLLFLIFYIYFSDFFQTNYRKICRAGLRQIFVVGRTHRGSTGNETCQCRLIGKWGIWIFIYSVSMVELWL